MMDAAGVFVVSTTGALTTLHDFTLSDGANPSSELIEASDGTLYCAAQMGGPDDGGVIIRIRLATSTPGQYFELVSRNSATCLDVFGAATDAAASVIQWVCHGGENQLPSRVTNRAAPARDIQWVTTYCASGQSACPAGSVLCQSGERAGVVQPILCKPP